MVRLEQMNLFPLNSILEEEIFTPRSQDPDCDTIGQLLYRFSDKFILSALEDGERCPVKPGMTFSSVIADLIGNLTL